MTIRDYPVTMLYFDSYRTENLPEDTCVKTHLPSYTCRHGWNVRCHNDLDNDARGRSLHMFARKDRTGRLGCLSPVSHGKTSDECICISILQ
jgi:hypothetical protein